MTVDENTSLEELFNEAKLLINNVRSDEEFIVKELFRGFEWNRISKGNRTKLGMLILNYSNNEGKKIIQPIGKTQQNQQKYRKV